MVLILGVASVARADWQQDHQNMMEQLGIAKLRPGPSGQAGRPDSANYDEAKANPFPDLPEVLVLKDGAKVTSAEMWKVRRVRSWRILMREVIGRVPKDVPKVTWSVSKEVKDGCGGKDCGGGEAARGACG